MAIHLLARRRFDAPIETVFALSVDPQRFPDTFRGAGPIPALRRIEADGPPQLGATRRLESSDGSVLHEHITAWSPPQQHDYTLEGFRAPMAWLVRSGLAQWRLRPEGSGTEVEWTYTFEPRSTLAAPLARLLLRGFMLPAMQRCLAAMAEALRPAVVVTH